jgi:hypothetical protein
MRIQQNAVPITFGQISIRRNTLGTGMDFNIYAPGAATTPSYNFTRLREYPDGLATYDLMISSPTVGTTAQVLANLCRFIVIELPDWTDVIDPNP